MELVPVRPNPAPMMNVSFALEFLDMVPWMLWSPTWTNALLSVRNRAMFEMLQL